jgi:hypothetical protein
VSARELWQRAERRARVNAGGRWRRLGQRTGGTGQERGERLVAAAGRLGAQARGWPRLERGAGGARLAGIRTNGGRSERRVVRADSRGSTVRKQTRAAHWRGACRSGASG